MDGSSDNTFEGDNTVIINSEQEDTAVADNVIDLEQRRRLAAIQLAAHLQYPSIDDFIDAAVKVDEYLAGGRVKPPKGDEGTNEFPLGE